MDVKWLLFLAAIMTVKVHAAHVSRDRCRDDVSDSYQFLLDYTNSTPSGFGIEQLKYLIDDVFYRAGCTILLNSFAQNATCQQVCFSISDL